MLLLKHINRMWYSFFFSIFSEISVVQPRPEDISFWCPVSPILSEPGQHQQESLCPTLPKQKALPGGESCLKDFPFFIDLLAPAPFWTCLPLSHYMLLLGLVEVLPLLSVDAFSLQQVISMSLPETVYKKKISKAAFLPACLPLQEVPLLRGNSTARYLIQRLLHQGLLLDKYHKNIT